MRKMDVKGSKYLYTTGVATKSDGNGTGLYSVDENGKVSLVFSECFYANNEDSTINLSIVPSFMYNFHNKYLILQVDDQFEGIGIYDEYGNECPVDKDGNPAGRRYLQSIKHQYYQEENLYHLPLCIVVRIDDGKMFYIPTEQYWEIFSTLHDSPDFVHSAINKNNDLYLSNFDKLWVVRNSADQLTIQELNPEGVGLLAPKILNNGTVLTRQYQALGHGRADDYCFVYPGGGYEFFDNTFECFRDQTDKREGYYLYCINGEIKALKVTEGTEYGDEDDGYYYTIDENVELYDFNVGTSYGSCSFGESIASYTRQFTNNQEPTRILDILCPWGGLDESDSVDSETHALLGDTFVWDKTSDELIMLEQETHDILVAMESNQAYDGKLWSLDHQVGGKVVVSSFHMATQTTNTETYDIGAEVGGFRMKNYTLNMGNGTSILNGTRLSDGKSIVVTLEFSTGQISVSENEDAANITNLVPMN